MYSPYTGPPRYIQGSYHQGSSNQASYNPGSYNQASYNQGSYNRASYHQGNYNQASYNQGSYNQGSYNPGGHNRASYSQGSYQKGTYDNKDMKIAVMGATGTGKSRFIKTITKDEAIVVGHSLDSQTTEIKLSRTFDVDVEGGSVTFIDTPGFDDSRGAAGGMSDSDILRQIAAFLQNEFQANQMLTGLIYTHRITDPRMGGTSKRNLRLFRKLCGNESMQNVIILTTMWDKVDIEEGIRRENELKTEEGFFKDLIDAGARLVRMGYGLQGREFPDPEQIVANLILQSNPGWTRLQKELAEGKGVGQTSAGSELDGQIQELIAREQQQAREAAAAALKERDEQARMRLEQERWRAEQEVRRREEERRQLMQNWEYQRAAESMRMAEAAERQRQYMDWERRKTKKKKRVVRAIAAIAVLAFL
ncbi:hypothetical protein JAAARDRAFT_39754 [Jaapia argillacea MUCL 33604]|uniref:G domain-containing protein n=1 Tax=Jaapia argillacea MUCL 33604 TaxID=933084 RepID=A0A067PDQ7_9AGAM|nr:hypothetical protein JAAARDRAFT_39754 [Jaapia argillacea MUCL 33604]